MKILGKGELSRDRSMIGSNEQAQRRRKTEVEIIVVILREYLWKRNTVKTAHIVE